MTPPPFGHLPLKGRIIKNERGIQIALKISPPFEANLSSHLNLSQLQKMRWRSLPSVGMTGI
jgi:hypothetical protein